MKLIDTPPGVLAALEAAVAPHDAHQWRQPEDLSGSLLPVPAFDPDKLLPEALRAFCVGEARRMQCHIEYVAVTLLVALGSTIGRSFAVYPKAHDDWYEYANIWGACVGRPSQMKSPAMSVSLAPLNKLADAANRSYADQLRSHETELALYELKVDALEKQLKSKQPPADAIGKHTQLMREKPAPPEHRRYIINDATVEKLGVILRDNPRGVLTARDELIGLLQSFQRQGREGDRAFYLEAWSAKQPFVVDRVGRGTTWIPSLCLSIIGGIQPSVLQGYLHELREGANDGFLQRLQLAVYPDEVQHTAIVDEAPDQAARTVVDRVFFDIAHKPAADFGAQTDPHRGIQFLRFEAGKAQTAFLTWLMRLQSRAMQQDLPEMNEHLSK